MKRIHFYPSSTLDAKLEADAKARNLSVSALVVDIVNAYYGLSTPNTLPLADLIKKVFDEVSDYISDPKAKTEFALPDASPTYKAIDMTGYRRPRIIRAKIGVAFSRLTQKPGRFSSVAVIRSSNGNVKTNVNGTTLYQLILPVIQPIKDDMELEFSYELRDNLGADVGRIICKGFPVMGYVEIDSFCIMAKWRGRGLGQKLFQHVVSEAIAKSYCYISVTPLPFEEYDDIEPLSKDKIVQIYKRLGFIQSSFKNELIYNLQ